MNIAINTRLLQKGKLEGIGWFTFQAIKRICLQHKEHQFFFIFDRPYDKEFVFSRNITPIVAGLPTRHPVLWWLWFEVTVPKVLKSIDADIFISTDNYTSLRAKTKKLTVIHDINFHHHPEFLPFLVEKYYNFYVKRFAKKSDRLVTVSEYSKQDIANAYNINPKKIDVCYNGITQEYNALPKLKKNQVREQYTNGENYFLFVGALNPRKNIEGVLKSFDIYKKNGGKHKLVIVGDNMHKTKTIENVYQNCEYKSQIIFTGRLELKELTNVMASAFALVFVPFFEGFGIPIIEAMKCEVPVICGKNTSLPEVAGEAGIFVDEHNNEQIAEKMLLLEKDNTLRKTHIEKGIIQASKFSWDKTAENLWKSIELVINNA